VLRNKIKTIPVLDGVARREWYYTMDLMLLACCVWLGRLQIGIHLPLRHMANPIRVRMVHELNRLIQEHRQIWCVTSRIGGLNESSSFLERVRNEMQVGLTENEMEDWRHQGRGRDMNGSGNNNGYPSPEKKKV
jgi:hypothetical protein